MHTLLAIALQYTYVCMSEGAVLRSMHFTDFAMEWCAEVLQDAHSVAWELFCLLRSLL